MYVCVCLSGLPTYLPLILTYSVQYRCFHSSDAFGGGFDEDSRGEGRADVVKAGNEPTLAAAVAVEDVVAVEGEETCQ